MMRLILSAFFAAALAAPAWAGYAEGRAAGDAGDYATALLEWRPLADAGDAAAQASATGAFDIGVMHQSGEGLPRAMSHLGTMYRDGRDVSPDPGPADGLPGPRTNDAIRKFETDRHLPVAGAVSPELLAALRQAQTATQ